MRPSRFYGPVARQRCDVKWHPVSRITIPLARKKKIGSLDFEEENAREGCQGNFKISQPMTFYQKSISAVM